MKFYKILSEEIDRDDILYHTIEMFGYGEDYRDSSFLTYEGDYIGKMGDSEKIAEKVLSVMNIETNNPIKTYLNKTQSVEMKYVDGDIIVSILKGNTLSEFQINMITDLLHSIRGDVIIKIIGAEEIEYVFEQHEVNKLKRFLRRLEGLSESIIIENNNTYSYENLPDVLQNTKEIMNADSGGVLLYKEEDGILKVYYDYICHVSSLRKFIYYSRMNPKQYPLKLNSNVLRDYKLKGVINIVHSLLYVKTNMEEFEKYINENDELYFEDLLDNNEIEREDIIEKRNL